MTRLWAICGVVATCAMITAASATAAPSAREALARPWHLPRVAPGAACPTSRVDPGVQFADLGVAEGIGRGPAYPLLPHAVLFLAPASGFASTRWAGAKVLWLVHPAVAGPVLIRGRRLDGPGLVRFGRGKLPAAELRIHAGWPYRPSFTRLRSPGCYAYQIDGPSFSRVVVFRAVGQP